MYTSTGHSDKRDDFSFHTSVRGCSQTTRARRVYLDNGV
jgi:hypothetical protein